jgi:HAMP domain-containing protein
MTSSSQARSSGSAHRRRTYLLNPRFQLKYTGLLVSVVLAVLVSLGTVIWQTSTVATRQAELAAGEAERALKESATSARILRMSAAAYANEAPDLGRTLDQDLSQIDREHERNLGVVAARRAEVESQRRRMLYVLVGGGALLLVVLGVLGVFITHRIVGPVHRLKRLCRQVGTARLGIGERLRKGDELEDLFDTFIQMTYSLKALQTGRLVTLDATIERAKAEAASPEVLASLRALRAQLCLGLNDDETLRPSMRPSRSSQKESA